MRNEEEIKALGKQIVKLINDSRYYEADESLCPFVRKLCEGMLYASIENVLYTACPLCTREWIEQNSDEI